MASRQKWRTTPIGRAVVFVGGLRFAVPIMVLVAVALAIGTYLDSTQGAKVASRLVYGSWWFVALMVLVALSLIFAVVTRYPWKRRHIGFITVHAGLVALMIGGFWSLFGRVEGRIGLVEGMSKSAIELDAQQVDLVAVDHGVVQVKAATLVHQDTRQIELDGHRIRIAQRWENVKEESYVADDGPEPLRAVELAFGSAPGAPRWIGQASKSGGPAFIDGMTIRVLGAGETWTAPAAPSASADYAFTFNGQTFALGEAQTSAFPGWRIVSVRRFASAQVGPEGLQEVSGGVPNPAVEVTISDGKGNTERHTAFQKFPDMKLSRPVEGMAVSGASLKAVGSVGETLVLHDAHDPMRATYVSATGEVRELEHAGGVPWRLDVGSHAIQLLGEVSRARMASRFVEAPPAEDFRSALIVEVDGEAGQTLVWKDSVVLKGSGLMLRYGPPVVQLPFTIELLDFRKTDYPGTEMAMAYESVVAIHADDASEASLTISMNQPYAGGGWKVYQSGFVNDNVSFFSVMKDPGLPLTYVGCIVLCVGIVITFYSRGLSWGHPGVATPFVQQERNHEAPLRQSTGHVQHVGDVESTGRAGRDVGPRDADVAAKDRDSGQRPGDAARLIRAQARGAADGAHEVVGGAGA
ncbi:MAG: cytochrome c biogenesis protein ResB [Phycisphaerales bacterium]|nr:cytochrome c biogenesis protein ResB [Phycisphaerales bacterium]